MIDVKIIKKPKKSGGSVSGSGGGSNIGIQATMESVLNLINKLSDSLVPVRRDGSRTQWGADDMFAVKSVKGFYSEEFVSARGLNPDASDVQPGLNEADLSAYLTLHNYAKKSDIPSLAGYAKLSDLPSLTGYATEQWVLDKKYLTDHQSLAAYLKSADAAATYLSKTDAATTYQAKEAGKGLSANDFTDALLTKLNGIEAGANKYTHPTGGANTTIAAASGKVLSAITVNNLGHVTSVASKTLAAADIPTLAISKISGLQAAIDAKLDKSLFDEMFTLETVNGVKRIKANYGLWTEQFLSARGANADASGASGGGLIQTVYGSSSLGKTFSDTALTDTFNAYTINAINNRLKTVEGKNYLDALSLVVSGTGNAVTAATLSADKKTLTLTKGSTFLTSHQSLAAYLTSASAASTYLAKTDAATTYLAKTDAASTYLSKTDAALTYLSKTDAAATYQAQEAGKGLSANDFTDALLTKLNGIEAGANKYTHPTGGANSTIAAASGKVLSAITVNSLGHVTSVASKTLAAADIPTLAISKISGLQAALDAKLEVATFTSFKSGYDTWKATMDAFKSLFDSMFAKDSTTTSWNIKALKGLWTESFLSARGSNSAGAGSGGGLVQTVYGSSSLGKTFSDATLTDTFNAYTINAINNRLKTVEGKNYLDALSLVVSGSGNAVTAATLSADKKTLTLTKGATYLTAITKALVEGVLTGNITSHTHSQYLTTITKAQVEAVLTGNITSHTHSQYLTSHQSLAAYLKSADAATTYLSKTDAAATYQPLEAGKGLSSNDFTDALLTKLNGIEAGANKYTHPTGGANSTIAAASGKVLSAITVNNLGHVTSVASKTLAAADIPTLAISKISGLQAAIDAKLDAATFTSFKTSYDTWKATMDAFKSLFDSMFAKDSTSTTWNIKALKGLWTESFLSARGSNSAGTGSGGGLVQTVYGSSSLGKTFSDATLTDTFNAYTINAINNRLKTVEGKNYLDALTLVVSGTGNAVTTATLSTDKKTLTLTKGATYLTAITKAQVEGVLTGNITSHTHSQYLTAITKALVEGVLTGNITSHTHSQYLTSHQSLAAYLKIDGSNGTAAGVSALINKLTEGSSVPQDDDYYVCQYAGGGTTTTTYHRRKTSVLWSYMKAKADAVYAAKATTLAGYGITNAYTKTEVDAKLTNGSVTKVGTATVGSTSKPIYLNAGTPTALSATVGSATKPVYMNGGAVTACSYAFGNGSGNVPVSNGTVNTNLNADLLDGKHDGNLTALKLTSTAYSSSTDDTSNLAIIKEHYTEIPDNQACAIRLSHGSTSMAIGWRLGGSYNSVEKAYCGWFVSDYGTPRWIGADNGTWKVETFAFTSSNVASATKLQTARSLWGQSFNGTGNVSGDLSSVGNITGSGAVILKANGRLTLNAVSTGVDLKFNNEDAKSVILNGTAFKPFDAANNKLTLGSTSARWSNTYSVLGNFSGLITASAGIKIGDVTITYDATKKGLKVSGGGLYSESYISAMGANTDGSAAGGGLIKTVYGSSSLGKTFSDATLTDTFNAYTINAINNRLKTVEGKNYLDALSLVVSGSGNAVTAATLSADKKTLTLTKGTTFLTSHQSLANYVTLNTAQTISGAKSFSSSIGIAQTAGTGVGISLYNGTSNVENYGILFGKTETFGKHGAVQGDWATYFTMYAGTTRGWIFRYKKSDTEAAPVASVSADGIASFKQVRYDFRSSSWYNARDNALLRTTGAPGSSYAPLWSAKTNQGSWDCGAYTANNMLYLSYVTDANYDAKTNSATTQITFSTAGAITASSFVKSGGTAAQFLKANGSVDSNTYATTAQLTNGSVTKVGTGTVGSTSKPIYLNAGTPTALSATVGSTTQPVYLNAGTVTAVTGVAAGYISEGGPHKNSSLGVFDIVSGISATNKFEALPAADVAVEAWSGSAWVDAGLTDAEKTSLVSYVGRTTSATQTNATSGNKLRVTITSSHIYCSFNKICINMSTNGAVNTKVLVERSKVATPTEYETVGTYAVGGWSGWNTIYLAAFSFGGSSYAKLRLTFTGDVATNEAHKANKLQVINVLGFGKTAWTTANNLNKWGVPYTYSVTDFSTKFEGSVYPKTNNAFNLGSSSLKWANVYAMTFNGALSGNASTATKLQTARTLWGKSFDGSAAITGDLTSVGNITGSAAVILKATGILTLLGTTGVYLKYNNEDAKSLVLNGTAFKPFDTAHNKLTLGSTSARWSNTYSVLGNFSGLITASAGIKIGDVTITYDATKKGLKLAGGGLYSETYISALGANTDSSAATGGGLIQTVYGSSSLGKTFADTTLTDTFNAYAINSIHKRVATLEGKNFLTAITKAQVEAVLTGNITSHTHSQYLTAHQSLANYYTKSDVDTKLTNGSVTKVGTGTVGSTSKPIYLNAGTPTALSATVGSTSKPVYMNGGTITALSATVGSASKPVYMAAGTITACSYTFGNGSGNAPISNGTVNTNLNADMLDGHHKDAFNGAAHYGVKDSYSKGYIKIKIKSETTWMMAFKIMAYQGYRLDEINVSGYCYGANHWYNPAASLICSQGVTPRTSINVIFGYDGTNKLWVAIPAANYAGVAVTDVANGYTQVADRHDLFEIVYEETLTGTSQTTVTPYRHATVNETAPMAKCLETSRTLWGQSFDGTAAVSGNMTSVGNITGTGAMIVKANGRLTLTATATAVDLKLNNDDTQSCNMIGTAFKPFDAADGKLELGTDAARWKKLTACNMRLSSSTAGAGGDVYAELWRGTKASWKILNTGGELKFQSNYTDKVGTYFDCMVLYYNTGNAYFKNDLAIGTTTFLSGYIHSRKHLVMGWSNLFFTKTVNGAGKGLYFAPTDDDGTLGLYAHEARTYKISSFKFYYDGTFYAKTGIYSDGYVSAKGQNSSSDRRLKTDIRTLELSLDDITKAPLVKYKWKDSGRSDVGTIAQYWQCVLPEVVGKDRAGYLTVDYGKLAHAEVITVALRTKRLEERVAELERENGRLKQKLNALTQSII